MAATITHGILITAAVLLCFTLPSVAGRRSRTNSRHQPDSDGRRSSGGLQTYSRYSKASKDGVYVYGYPSYQKRHRHRSDYNPDPRICSNDDRWQISNVTNTTTSTYNGYFVCPDNEVADNTWCCGDEGSQYCCTFWDDDTRLGGTIGGTVVGSLVLITTCAVIGWCCCKKKCCRPNNQEEIKPSYNPSNEGSSPAERLPLSHATGGVVQ